MGSPGGRFITQNKGHDLTMPSHTERSGGGKRREHAAGPVPMPTARPRPCAASAMTAPGGASLSSTLITGFPAWERLVPQRPGGLAREPVCIGLFPSEPSLLSSGDVRAFQGER